MVKRVLKIIISVGFALTAFLGVYAFTVIAHTPKIEPDKLYDYLSERSVILDDKGDVVNSVHLEGGNRSNIKYEDMPQDLIDAVVSIEDRTFWNHNGFNYFRMLGAIKDSLVSGDSVGGTSTVTQQLARNVYLSETKSVRSLSRKISEAYYTVVLEHNLSKEEIMEAYLNTIYLGNGSYGVQAAAKVYFNKDAKDLDLLECASLAALPQAPDRFALVKKVGNSEEKSAQDSEKPVLAKNSDYVFYYNGEVSKKRRDTTLEYMLKNEYISKEEYDNVKDADLSKKLNLTGLMSPDSDSYFTDYVVDQVVNDLMEKYDYSREEAIEKLYTGGLTIHSTLDTKAQQSIDEVFSKPENFPSLVGIRYDGNKNIIGDRGQILLSPYSSYFDDTENFTLSSDEYKEDNGNLVLLKDKRLKFYKTKVNGKTDYSIEFKDLYKMKNGVLYSIRGGAILVPQQYKSLDDDGNLVISAKLFEDSSLAKEGSSLFAKSDSGYVVSKEHYKLHSEVRQPQGAMVITDSKTGHLKAMVGGRETVGKKLYNRAINPRQPGSAIKPIAIYSEALQQGKEAADAGRPMNFKTFDDKQLTENYGDYWTAASVVNDAPIKYKGKDWPKNWYNSYRGPQSMQTAIELSTNTIPVRIYQQIGDQYIIDMLEKFGVTSIVKEGDANDRNPSALALGGMSKGISPLEMCSAFSVFPNQGERVEVTCYTKVVSKSGEVLLEPEPKKHQVLDKGVAFIMQDLLVSALPNGIAKRAAIPGTVVGGKTGTTSDAVDLWFTGFTPKYTAALWVGSDVNIQIDNLSYSAAGVWAKIMAKATAGMGGSLPGKPDNVIEVNGVYFIKGTEKNAKFNYVGVEEEEAEEEGEEETVETNPDEQEEAPEANPQSPPPSTEPPANN